MNESDCYLVEFAYEMGFVPNDDADGGTFTDEQLVAFARRLIEWAEKRAEKRVREEKPVSEIKGGSV
jgi:hypothetical protein